MMKRLNFPLDRNAIWSTAFFASILFLKRQDSYKYVTESTCRSLRERSKQRKSKTAKYAVFDLPKLEYLGFRIKSRTKVQLQIQINDG